MKDSIDLSKLAKLEKDYGYVIFFNKNLRCEQKYILIEDAVPFNEETYYAHAYDLLGNIYAITWDTNNEWRRKMEKYQVAEKIKNLYGQGIIKALSPDEIQTMSDGLSLETYLEDESNACDWDNPDSVELYKEF